MKPRVIAVDIDQTLTIESCWTAQEALQATPNQKMVDYINELHKSDFIVIYTARRHELYNATVKWLKAHDVRYHAIQMEKMPADLYLDDRALNPEDIK